MLTINMPTFKLLLSFEVDKPPAVHIHTILCVFEFSRIPQARILYWLFFTLVCSSIWDFSINIVNFQSKDGSRTFST